MKLEFSPAGISLPDLGLWLDPHESVPFAWFSHAHADHAREYPARVIGTPATLDFYRQRWPENGCPQLLERAEYEEWLDVPGGRLQVLPAGHILGAAMLLVESGGERLIYTGDVKWRHPLCGVPTRMVPCDTLIIESTFGLPLFQFMEREQAAARITGFARECVGRGEVPVFLGYPLGRGQELAHVLADAEIPTAVHGAIARYFPRYEAAGYGFGAWEPYDRTRSLEGRALVTVPAHVPYLPANARVAAVSGWAAMHNARARYQASELIPYSDHADFHELIELVRHSQARRVWVVHGYAAALAKILRDRLGVDARAAARQDSRQAEEE